MAQKVPFSHLEAFLQASQQSCAVSALIVVRVNPARFVAFVRTKRCSFLSFSSPCPEPVLVKRDHFL